MTSFGRTARTVATLVVLAGVVLTAAGCAQPGQLGHDAPADPPPAAAPVVATQTAPPPSAAAATACDCLDQTSECRRLLGLVGVFRRRLRSRVLCGCHRGRRSARRSFRLPPRSLHAGPSPARRKRRLQAVAASSTSIGRLPSRLPRLASSASRPWPTASSTRPHSSRGRSSGRKTPTSMACPTFNSSRSPPPEVREATGQRTLRPAGSLRSCTQRRRVLLLDLSN